MKHFIRTTWLTIAVPLAAVLFIAGCTDDDTPITPVETTLAPPTNIRGASDDGSIHLLWQRSKDEGAEDWKQYVIKVYDNDDKDTLDYAVGAGISATLTGLNNGTIYDIYIYSESTEGELSDEPSSVTWSPAKRITVDDNEDTIRVYATTSQFDSGLDIYNSQEEAELLPQSGSQFAERGDLFVYADNNSAALEIVAPQEASINPGQVTLFADIDDIEASYFDIYSTAPPADAFYRKTRITLPLDPVSSGRLYYGKIKRNAFDFFFRMIVVRGLNGKLVQGSDADRYIELRFSYQTERNVRFAKRIR